MRMFKQGKPYTTNKYGIITSDFLINTDGATTSVDKQSTNFCNWLFNELTSNIILSSITEEDIDKELVLVFDDAMLTYYVNMYTSKEDADGDSIYLLYDYWGALVSQLGYKQVQDNTYPDELHLIYNTAISAKLPSYINNDNIDWHYNSHTGKKINNLKDVFSLKNYFNNWFNATIYNYLISHDINDYSYTITIPKDKIPVWFTNNKGTMYHPFIQYIKLYGEYYDTQVLSNGDVFIRGNK